VRSRGVSNGADVSVAMTRPDAQNSTASGVGVAVTFQAVPRSTTSPVVRLLHQVPEDAGAHAPVDADIDEIAERFPAASTASTPSWYVVPQVRPSNTVVVPAVLPIRVEPR